MQTQELEEIKKGKNSSSVISSKTRARLLGDEDIQCTFKPKINKKPSSSVKRSKSRDFESQYLQESNTKQKPVNVFESLYSQQRLKQQRIEKLIADSEEKKLIENQLKLKGIK